jgi:hypothetical protein
MAFKNVDFSGELFSCFAFHVALVVLKVILMVPLTARQRFRKGVRLLVRANSVFWFIAAVSSSP